jgi:hypothetical protein
MKYNSHHTKIGTFARAISGMKVKQDIGRTIFENKKRMKINNTI